MDITVFPKKLYGTINAVSSKSQAHRLLICAAFADKTTELVCPDTSLDIEATAECLRSLGARIARTPTGYTVIPVSFLPDTATLNCHESGSTLRFIMPLVGALGIDATFLMEGRLPDRPISPLWEEMERMGCDLSRSAQNKIRCTGKLKSGEFTINGTISSQFISGLLLSCAIMDGESFISITGALESRPYVDMTLDAMKLFGKNVENFHVVGGGFTSPGKVTVEGDWSNGAFFIAANAIGSQIALNCLDPSSAQGDKAITRILSQMEHHPSIYCSDIPDLVPILSIVAAAKKGARFTGVRRLRSKESDRIASVIAMLEALGGEACADEDILTVHPCEFHGGTVDAWGDHRVAMAAAIAATAAAAPVTIRGAECVSKSYPGFWEDYRKLGGCYEQHIR